MSLDDLSKLIDSTASGIATCEHIQKLGKILERGEPLSVSDSIVILQDLAHLRYMYTVERVQQQAIEILSRTWDRPAEAIVDLRQAKRLIAWALAQYKLLDIEGGTCDETA